MRTGVAAAAVLASSSLLLAACASAPTPGPGDAPVAHTSPTPSPPASGGGQAAAPGDGCVVYLYGHAARAEVSSSGVPNSAEECTRLASSLSSGGEFWTTQAMDVQGIVPAVCAVHKGNEVVVVRDNSSQIYGQSLCSTLLQNGWTEDATAEQGAQQQDQATAQASAQASAQAATQSKAQDALSVIQSAIESFTNAKTVRDDVQTADDDLAAERVDAKGGNGDSCYNVEDVVGYDAENAVGYDVLTSASYDVDQEQQAIQSMRTQIAALKEAEAALTAAGLPALTGSSAAIVKAEANNALAVATTNKAIDDLNADLRTGYRIANNLGTGDCADSGPGQVPDGLSHIS